MHTYTAYVRAPFGDSTIVVKTQVQAENTNAATFLLRGQYGTENVVSIPQQIDWRWKFERGCSYIEKEYIY